MVEGSELRGGCIREGVTSGGGHGHDDKERGATCKSEKEVKYLVCKYTL